MASVTDAKVSPSNLNDLREAIQGAAEHGFAVTSGGTASASGTLISLEKLSDVALDEGSGTVRAGAGALLKSLRSALQKQGFMIPGLGDRVRSERVGSLVARGEIARRGISGIEAVLSNGDVVKHGGTVQKDVAGYDIASLLLGSQGRLAVITEVVFRVAPAKAAIAGDQAPGEIAITPVPGLTRAFDSNGALSRE